MAVYHIDEDDNSRRYVPIEFMQQKGGTVTSPNRGRLAIAKKAIAAAAAAFPFNSFA